MELTYKSHKIKKQVKKACLSNKIAKRRLLQISSATCYIDLPSSAKAHFLEGNLKHYFAIDFGYPTRLICEPVGEYQKNDNGEFIKNSISSIEIIEIKKDYH